MGTGTGVYNRMDKAIYNAEKNSVSTGAEFHFGVDAFKEFRAAKNSFLYITTLTPMIEIKYCGYLVVVDENIPVNEARLVTKPFGRLAAQSIPL